jgi:hypothetical protein
MPLYVHVQALLGGRFSLVDGHVRQASCPVLLLQVRHGHPVWRCAVTKR